jgi:D-glycero-D-manno-heptose 1,7-bisphosphate phosphatase
MSRPCIFFDRDGVVNRSPGDGRYILSIKEFHLMPGLLGLLRTIADADIPTIIATSQRCVAKGLMSLDELDSIHGHLQDTLETNGTPFLDIYACTHLPVDRHRAKPNPDMLLEAAEKHDLDLSRSMIIGDADRDIQMGLNAKVGRTIRLRGEKAIGVVADHTCGTLEEIDELLQELIPSVCH